MTTKKKVKGRLILEEIAFDDAVKRTVHKSNKSSGKITLPKEWIDKKVYVVLIE
ncbi:MAG: DUF2080 family transposase-associated protein [Candidatus Altiarchaeota archaeon]|nr:DUF2080 family transposase-associated protein [Candidatus Altiarchaeota archaeon]